MKEPLSNNPADYEQVLSNVQGLINSLEQLRESLERLGDTSRAKNIDNPEVLLRNSVLVMRAGTRAMTYQVANLEAYARNQIDLVKEVINERNS